jgi:Ca-activated chloride channel family protein
MQKFKVQKWMAAFAASVAMAMSPVSQAKQIEVNVSPGNGIVPAGKTSTTYVQISLKGLPRPVQTVRADVNMAIVLDKSGSMQGRKIQHAKQAAIKAVQMLGPNDIVSVVTYDTTVHVLVPATKASDRHNIINAINQIQAGGSTALFGGVSKGAYEVRKFISDKRVNRVILLSDGLANHGPSTPGELGALGRSLGSEGITVSTIGLGLDYNEDLMTQLAMNSDGNHMFAETPEDVARAFEAELGDVLSVVAQEVSIVFNCADGVRPIRVLGRDAEISGQRMQLSMNQLYNEQTKFVILEVEVPATSKDISRQVGVARIEYTDMQTQTRARQEHALIVRAGSQNLVDESEHKSIMASVIHMQAVENNKKALALRDKGQVEEAKEVLISNTDFLDENARKYESEKLKDYGASNRAQVKQFDQDDASFKKNRKMIVEEQHVIQMQQKVAPKKP